MNKKIKLKYLYNLYKVSPLYPSEEDLLFEITKGLEESNLLNETFTNFQIRPFYERLPNGYKNERELMSYFVSQNVFEIMEQQKVKNAEIVTYKIKNNPML